MPAIEAKVGIPTMSDPPFAELDPASPSLFSWKKAQTLGRCEVPFVFEPSETPPSVEDLAAVACFWTDLASFDARARTLLHEDTLEEDSTTREYLEHYLEELPFEVLTELFGDTDDLEMSTFIETLVLVRVALSPTERFAVFDYAIGLDIADHVLAVSLATAGDRWAIEIERAVRPEGLGPPTRTSSVSRGATCANPGCDNACVTTPNDSRRHLEPFCRGPALTLRGVQEPMTTRPITESNFETTVEKGVVLLDFWASWCGPCRTFGPVFEAASKRHPDVVFGKVDTESQPGLARTFQVRAIPTVTVMRDGIVLGTQQGMVPAAGLDELVRRAKALDMDEVRRSLEAQVAPAQGPASANMTVKEGV